MILEYGYKKKSLMDFYPSCKFFSYLKVVPVPTRNQWLVTFVHAVGSQHPWTFHMVSECFKNLLRNILNLVWVELVWVSFPIQSIFFVKSCVLMLPLQFDELFIPL